MYIVNLDIGYDPYRAGDDILTFDLSTFAGGEPHIKFAEPERYDTVQIATRIRSFNDIGVLLMAIDALERMKMEIQEIVIPYFPGARQDRVMQPGEALSVKVYADIFNRLEYPITIIDPHSDVTPALLDQCDVITNHKFVSDCLSDIWNTEPYGTAKIISPDAGANKKSLGVMKALSDSFQLVKCDKTRNVTTGVITDFHVYTDDLLGHTCFLVDDICSNGGTFMGLADKLIEKGAGDIYLIVTHGEFGRDRLGTLANLQKKFKGVYYSDSFPAVENASDFAKQIKITE